MFEDINELSVKPEVGNSTKPLLAAVFLFEFQRVKKYFEISLKKVLQLSKWFVYLYR